MNLLLKERFIIRGGDRLGTTSWKLSWLAGRRAVESAVFRGPATFRAWRCQRTTTSIAARNWINAQFCESPQSRLFLYIFSPLLALSLFILSVCFLPTPADVFSFVVCLKAGTVVFKGLCGVFRRLLSLHRDSIVYYPLVSHKCVLFISGLMEINLAKQFKSYVNFQPRSV
jgi:hypothetical protein